MPLKLKVQGTVRRKADVKLVLELLGIEDARVGELKRGARFQIMREGGDELLNEPKRLADLVLDTPLLDEKIKTLQCGVFNNDGIIRMSSVNGG